MMRIWHALTNPRFIRYLLVPHALFFAIAWWTDAQSLIAFLNPVDIALSIAVCVAFLPSLIDMIWGSGRTDSAGMMVAGIFLGWLANAARSIWSMVWRAMGMPEWFANTDVTSYILFILGYGAVCHLIAPDSIGGRVPAIRWIKLGTWAGIGVFAAITLSHQSEIQFAVGATIRGMAEWMHPAHDRSAPVVHDPPALE